MKYMQIVAAVLVGYVLLRLTGRVHRLELVTGAWRTQAPEVEISEATRLVIAALERELRDAA